MTTIVSILRSGLLSAAAPIAAFVAGEASTPPRIEKVAVRDVLQQDGSGLRSLDVRVRVRDAMDVSRFGQIASPYIAGYGEVEFEVVVIEKPDGRRVEVRDAATEDINPLGMSGSSLPADYRIRRLTVPGLAAGDVLEYRIVTRHKPLFSDIVFGEYRFFTGPDTGEQSYELDIPASLPLSVRAQPELASSWQDALAPAGRRIRRLIRRAPAGPPGDLAGSQLLEEPDVEYTTFRSWDQLAGWWWGLVRDAFLPDQAVRAEAARLGTGQDDVRARMQALHAFVGAEIRYLGVGFGSGRYLPRPAPEVLAARYADCKGKHSLLAALASSLGIEVWPALVHFSRRELHDDVPSPAQFNHLVSVVRLGADPAEWLWLDATTDLAPAGYLLPNLRGKRALLVDREGGRVVRIPEHPPFPTRLAVETRGVLDPAGPLRARVRWTMRGDAEVPLRALVRMAPREKWTELGKGLAEEWDRGVVSDLSAGDAGNLREPFWIEYGVEHTMTSATFEKEWTLWIPLPDLGLPEWKARSPGDGELELGLDDEISYRARVELPEGMRARAPLSMTLDRPFASYRSTYAIEGRTLSVERVLQVRRRAVGSDESAAYESFRTATTADRSQAFRIEAFRTASADAPENADALNSAGKAALDDRGDAELAARLLRRAVEKDPNHKWAWNNLGRALRKLNRPEEALTAFGRQIQINAFDAYAYDNRGSTLLFDLDRRDESEKDFHKQIEVAPLEPYAYEDLAYLRTLQERFDDASALLERAAALQPSKAAVWLKLAWARARAGSGDIADAVQRARSLDAAPRTAVIAARALAVGGSAVEAAGLARDVLPGLLASLDSADPVRLEDERAARDLLYVAEAWRLIGAAALHGGDLATAERYLAASWDLGSTPDGATSLGQLREKQGRPADAVPVWQQASFLRAWRGNPARKELERVVTDPAQLAALLEAASQEMAKRQVQKLPGAGPDAAVEVRVRLLVDERGGVLAVGPQKAQDAGRLLPLRERVLAARLVAPNPDSATFKLVRGATVTCYPHSGCMLGLDLYGDEVARVLER